MNKDNTLHIESRHGVIKYNGSDDVEPLKGTRSCVLIDEHSEDVEDMAIALERMKGESVEVEINDIKQKALDIKAQFQDYMVIPERPKYTYITVDKDIINNLKKKVWPFLGEMWDLVDDNELRPCTVVSTSKKRWKVIFDDGSYKYYPRKNKATNKWEPVRRFD